MDTKTLILALAMGNLTLYAALLLAGHDHKRLPRMSVWALAKQCQAVAWVLFYLRGVVPDLLSFPLANALLFTGLALDAGALWDAAGRASWRRYTLPVLATAVLLFLGFHAFDAPAPLRSAAAAFIAAAFVASACAALAFGWGQAGRLRRALAVAVGILSVLLAARGVLSFSVPVRGAWLSAEAVRQAGLGVLYLVMLVNGFGYLTLSRQKLEQELARLEVVDALTEVPNRRGFYQALAPWMALARRPGMPTALIVLNLDHFKRINDSYGHQVGDAVLKSMVEECRKQLRDSDLMGRLGGAEFAIQLPRTALADALMVAERIREAVAQLPVKTERAVLNLTASLGVTTIRAEDSTVSLFKRADEALQAAKAAGRNRVAEAEPASVLEA